MRYLTKVINLKTAINNTLTEAVEKSEQRTMRWKGTGGEQYINLDFNIKHDGNYCATEYKALMIVNNCGLHLHTDERCNRGTSCDVSRLPLEQLAELADLLN